jgi:hypothetical protein
VLIVPKKIQVKTMSNQVLSRPGPQAEPCCPRKIPLYLHLSESSAPRLRLTNPAESACAEAVVSWLSSQCDRVVELAELEGLLLYLWSEDDVEGRALDEYLASDRPLQALLLQARGLSGECDRLTSAELLPFIGQRFEFAVEVPSCA